jgi:hypothetical protein
MFAPMTEKRRKPGRPKVDDPKALSLGVRATAQHYRQLRLAAARTRGRSVSTEILVAIEEHLAKLKLWPPPENQ